jgi:hypothetical protein
LAHPCGKCLSPASPSGPPSAEGGGPRHISTRSQHRLWGPPVFQALEAAGPGTLFLPWSQCSFTWPTLS